ncbi:hypothetical protein LAZ67_20001264 [Cordylochernes scorpioides]|uniref:Uncharacterized protein n=1 Tax=Cordylochernes scorpioides TaxID=51811 RepID=A0ABY6LPN3_9ARAC|nr:hypothetical protein LAZ67_20001264 [Cordylochernes scorpioides]
MASVSSGWDGGRSSKPFIRIQACRKWIKFQYLIQSMRVKSYPLTEANYPKVIEALRDRIGDKVILIEVYVRLLLKLLINNVRKKMLSLESLYDQVESHKMSLDSLGVNLQQYSSFLYPLVKSSLPEELLRIWKRSALAGYEREETELTPSVRPEANLYAGFCAKRSLRVNKGLPTLSRIWGIITVTYGKKKKRKCRKEGSLVCILSGEPLNTILLKMTFNAGPSVSRGIKGDARMC